MKKKIHYILIICIIITSNHLSYSQCSVTAKALYGGDVYTDTVEVCQGGSVMLFAEDSCKNPNCSGVILQSDFNNMTLGNGWSSTLANPVFNNPCQCPFVGGQPPSTCNNGVPGQAGPDGAYLWIGTTPSNERILETQFFDLTPYQNNNNCKIQFWMMYGITPNSGSCEDPDEAAEGVHLQYSVNNGAWTDFPGPIVYPVGNLSPTPPFITTTPGSGGYWAPKSALTAQLQSTVYFWNQYNNNLPSNIRTANTRFRWAQLATSSTGYDAWGLDNISIDCSYNNVIYNWSNGTNTNQNAVYPTNSGWYYIDVYDNCTSNPTHGYDSIYIKIKESPSSNGVITAPMFACKGSNNVEVSVTPLQNADIYQWSYSGNGATINGNSNVVYVDFDDYTTEGYFQVYAENECGFSYYIESYELYVGQSPQAATISQIADTLYSTASFGNHWFNTNIGEINGANSQSFIPYNTGSYYTKLFINGCWSNPSNIINYITSDINNPESDEYSLMLSPNPVTVNLKISYVLKEKTFITITLTDLSGKEILKISKGKQNSGKYNLELKTSEIAKGIYLVNFESEKNTLIKKLIIN
jgi:hypothetical protein